MGTTHSILAAEGEGTSARVEGVPIENGSTGCVMTLLPDAMSGSRGAENSWRSGRESNRQGDAAIFRPVVQPGV